MKKKHIHSSPSGELPPTVTCLIRYISNILSFCCNHLEVSPNELELNAQRNCKQIWPKFLPDGEKNQLSET